MRFGITPLYLDETDIDQAVATLTRILEKRLWDTPAFKTPRRRDLRYDMNRLANPSKRQSNWHVRPYRAEDATARAEVFRQAVQKGAAAHYDQVQRDAWAAGPSADSLKDRLAPQLVLVAVDSAGKVIGFLFPHGCRAGRFCLRDA